MDRYFTGRKRIAYMLTPVTEEPTTAIWENTYAESHSSQYAERIQGDKVVYYKMLDQVFSRASALYDERILSTRKTTRNRRLS